MKRFRINRSPALRISWLLVQAMVGFKDLNKGIPCTVSNWNVSKHPLIWKQHNTFHKKYFQEHDPNVERALKFQREINKLLYQYEEVYKDLTKNKRQMLISDFFIEKSCSTTENNPLIIDGSLTKEKILSKNESYIE